MTITLGLTGSIGMGKSTTAQFFANCGCAVWDADAAVHRLYQPGGTATQVFQIQYPTMVTDQGVDRQRLKNWIAQDTTALSKIEHIVHPLVAQDRATFLQNTIAAIAIFDIPLLFETNLQSEFDATACVVTDRMTQKKRVLARAGMTQAQFDLILSYQMPSDEKTALADYVIRTDTFDIAAKDVDAVMQKLMMMANHA
ncbi:MAG: dephospho-CoA kinase [Pseudomonadota bacterium]